MSSEATLPVEGDPFDLPRLCRYFSERSPLPMVAVAGPTHLVRYLNPAFAKISGREPNQLLGLPFDVAVPERTVNGCMGIFDRVFRTGVPENLPEQEHQQIPARYWSYAMWPILGENESPVGVMVQVTDSTDVATFRRQAVAMNEALFVSSVRQHELIETIRRNERERHDLEVQMFQAQKLESLGVLAGGIAHDLNNTLTPILGLSEFALEFLPDDSSVIPMLEQISKSSRRAADLVQQILAFAGKGRFVLELVDLSRLVREMSGLLKSGISVNCKIDFDLTAELPFVEGDVPQLRQVVVNLVTNASEAMAEHGGRIIIRTGLLTQPIPESRTSIWQQDLPMGPMVFLEVVDTGTGIPANLIDKIFDPFFSTKFTGRGLGLAVVQGIARGHHGAIRVHSEVGKGSSFRFLLPISKDKPTAPSVIKQPDRWRGTGTILVIDDERGIRDIVTYICERAGLTVLQAPNGMDGLKLLQERQTPLNVILLDMTMPGMNGLETAAEIRKLNSEIPIILMSGFSVQEITSQSASLSLSGFVQKPFNATDLLVAIRHALKS